MNSRQRFLETMRLGKPDHPPCFEEGMRDEVIDLWRQQGHLATAGLPSQFHYDQREEISTDLEIGLDLVKLSRKRSGLKELRRHLNPDNRHRMPENWAECVKTSKDRQHVLMLQVHHGFFLTMGVEGWASFEPAMYLLADQPEFVHGVLDITGELAARLAEKVLKEVEVDAFIFGEPISSTHGPLISPRMYREFMLRSYQPLLAVAAQYGVSTLIWRSYANSRKLLPEAVKMGFNCLWASECDPQAMNYLDIRGEYGPQLRLIAGIDPNVLRQDEDAIRREIEDKVPPLLAQGGYIPLAGGRVREDMPYENYCFYRSMLETLVGCA